MMGTTKIQFEINTLEVPFLKELLAKMGAVNIRVEEQKEVEIPQEHLESIQIGLTQLEQGFSISNEEVRKKVREICFK